ncbi:putative ABC transporter [Aspergillus mulundensis]|uniref:Putative ABC transporter n=1 Tax=Aspergillus mulundensis TaxID=1810919 RepID=A0A3D8R8W1_9EURO|nr:putative ABC transporter [Aspergillus mulundensis]RDW70493.1 putative ABC transporter [Aspergillus mulundensis]
MLRLPSLRTRPAYASRILFSRRALSSQPSAPPLIRIENGTFYQSYPTPEDEAKGTNPPIFSNLDFLLPSNPASGQQQHWAVIGASGRTQFLNVLRGQYISIPPTARSYPYLLTDEVAKKNPQLRYPGHAIQYIGFSGEGSGAIGGTRGAYLSARYESLREETDWTVRQYLRGQTSLNPLEEDKEGLIRDEAYFTDIVTQLRLHDLLDMPVANLSNGQTRRTRIAKALLGRPELLLLDDPFMGLDPATVRGISELLHRLASNAEPRLVLSIRPQDPIPDWITHLLILGNHGRVLLQEGRKEAKKTFEAWGRMAVKAGSTPKYQQIMKKAKADIRAGYLDKQLIFDMGLVPPPEESQYSIQAPRMGEALIEMDGVRVQYGDKVVLGNWSQKIMGKPKEGLHWTVRRGQRWVILGPNGSGKTTLLSLITSDHPQAYALPIKIFGRSRLPEPGKPPISLFELQSRIGHSSPEIHAFFPRQLTIRQAIESAFAETFLSKPVLSHDRDLDVSAALRFFRAELDPNFKAEPLRVMIDRDYFPSTERAWKGATYEIDYDIDFADNVTFGELSTEHQRVVLFLRAMIHKPDIVILDESFSGMTSSLRDKCMHFLEVGERIDKHSTATKRAGHKIPWTEAVAGREPRREMLFPRSFSQEKRHFGLTDQQALIMISHVSYEVPNIVRHYMRLPSAHPDDATGLDFRFGYLHMKSVLGMPAVWDRAWTHKDLFEKSGARKNFRRGREEGEVLDEDVYEYWSI